MMKLTEGSTNKPVPLKEIHAFGRMRRFQPYSAIVSALRESKFLNVTGEEGAEMISRKIAYDPTTPRSKTEARSVYVKGFGDEEPSSQFDIEAFFSQFGSTNAVRLRRTDQKLFKGSVFVEFSDEETAQKFLALDPKPLWKGKHILQIMSKKAYQDLKDQEIREGKVQPSESWGPRGRGKGRGGGRGGRGPRNDRGDRDKGDRDPNDWKKRREDDRANGFKDNRGGKNNRGQRGGRRGRRDDRGPRNNDRNEERAEKNGYVEPILRSIPPTNIIAVTNPKLRRKPLKGSRTRRNAHARTTAPRRSQQRKLITSLKFQPKPHDTPELTFLLKFL
jgi:lupus La protein